MSQSGSAARFEQQQTSLFGWGYAAVRGETEKRSRRRFRKERSAGSCNELSTLSRGTPPLRAISTPQWVRSSSEMEWASGLMLIKQPSSSARRCQRQSRSSLHGLALISTATPDEAQVA